MRLPRPIFLHEDIGIDLLSASHQGRIHGGQEDHLLVADFLRAPYSAGWGKNYCQTSCDFRVGRGKRMEADRRFVGEFLGGIVVEGRDLACSK